MKEYFTPKMEITKFENEDVIVTSGDSSQLVGYESTPDDESGEDLS